MSTVKVKSKSQSKKTTPVNKVEQIARAQAEDSIGSKVESKANSATQSETAYNPTELTTTATPTNPTTPATPVTETDTAQLLKLMTTLFQKMQSQSRPKELASYQQSTNVGNAIGQYKKIKQVLRVSTQLKPEIDEPKWVLFAMNYRIE